MFALELSHKLREGLSGALLSINKINGPLGSADLSSLEVEGGLSILKTVSTKTT